MKIKLWIASPEKGVTGPELEVKEMGTSTRKVADRPNVNGKDNAALGVALH